MRCERCREREAEIYLLKVTEGTLTSLHLCHPCAEQEHPGKVVGLLGRGTPFFIVRFQPGPEAAGSPSLDEERCPVCGLTYAAMEQEERLPCPECPESFEERIGEVLSRLEELPADSVSDPGGGTVYGELLRVQRRLKEAIASEGYEEAAGLREEIRRLQQILGKGGA
ncbi:MAG: UvrB/UvrC motif-containing protein [Candidatus Methylomirabilales bacterium]